MSNHNGRNIADTLARFVSLVFHPVFMPLYGLIILLSGPTFLVYLPRQAKHILLFVVLINNVIIPLAMLPFFRYRNIINSYRIEGRNERIIPLLTASILYCTTSFIIFRFQIPFVLKSFIFATSVLAIIVSIINFWWKISIHAVAAGALAAAVLVISFRLHASLTFYFAGVIMAGGLVLSSRLRLNIHNPSQVWVGFGTGFVVIALFILLV